MKFGHAHGREGLLPRTLRCATAHATPRRKGAPRTERDSNSQPRQGQPCSRHPSLHEARAVEPRQRGAYARPVCPDSLVNLIDTTGSTTAPCQPKHGTKDQGLVVHGYDSSSIAERWSSK
jgi:hypothetical protein